MLKTRAILLLGGSVAKAADAIGIKSSAVSQWPDDLPPRLADRVIAACVRTGVEIPSDVLHASPARGSLAAGAPQAAHG
nr:hypothetical protein [Variovorax boronicumulans]